MTTTSVWQSKSLPHFPKLASDQSCDVAIVGGGMTGLCSAYLLKQAGKRVCLLERDHLADVDTGHTTAHLSYVTDSRLSELVSSFGQEAARLVWEGGAAAIDMFDAIADAEGIDCEFQRVPGFLHAAINGEQDESAELEREYELARELGFHASYVESVPLMDRPGIRFSNQAKFHPRAFLAGLARTLKGKDCSVFESSEVTEVHSDPLTVKANGHEVRCEHLLIATHVPLMGTAGILSATVFQSKLAPYSSYAVGAKIPKGVVPAALFWDTSDPYYYLRIDSEAERDYAIFGGADHKTGQALDTEARFTRLAEVLYGLIPHAEIDCRWSGQVIETNDGLPYIGETAENQYVATGFAGNGMTFGPLSAMILCDRILGKENPWLDLFSTSRKSLRGGALDYVRENADYPYYMIKDRLASAEGKSTREVKRGEGKVLNLDGERVACSRDEQGRLQKVSAVCTHMGCLVHWNSAEKTWDCPCHGSRFQPSGEVLAGPAETPLEPVKKARAKSRPKDEAERAAATRD